LKGRKKITDLNAARAADGVEIPFRKKKPLRSMKKRKEKKRHDWPLVPMNDTK